VRCNSTSEVNVMRITVILRKQDISVAQSFVEQSRILM